jgi:hypothetical protein
MTLWDIVDLACGSAYSSADVHVLVGTFRHWTVIDIELSAEYQPPEAMAHIPSSKPLFLILIPVTTY